MFKRAKSGLPHPPRCAAVSLTVLDGSGVTYTVALLMVRREVNLFEFDIAEVRLRRAVTGALILKIADREKIREKLSHR